eukprot:TRINITY_DN4923_c0_g1_i1.p1 TRINITY_DN4923_c0_g1~~TRINITY_DN4923_c0_g1_i1.p1  ORF type:complete len:532 (+),score=86.31 TRINITY_DN4923_c0_g1_i1:36-1631(+)
MFTAESGWTVVEERQRRRGPLATAGRGLCRSASASAASRRCGDGQNRGSSLAGKSSASCSGSKRYSRSAATLPPGSPTLCEGMTVKLEGLEGAVELNGSCGILSSFDKESGRWIVDVSAVGEKKVKPEKIRPIDHAAGLKSSSDTWPIDHAAGLKSSSDTWCDKWLAEYDQEGRCAKLGRSRQQKRVRATLEALGGCFEPSEGLAAAAASLAREALAKVRTREEQQRSANTMAKPREVHVPVEPAPPATPSQCRSRAEQQAYVDLLACPRLPRPETPTGIDAAVGTARSASVQRQRCADLAQPRYQNETLSKPWRQELIARANALVGEEVASAQALLADMRLVAIERERTTSEGNTNAGVRSGAQPSSANRKGMTTVAPLAREPLSAEVESLATELRAVAEEILWAVLLQLRCCRDSDRSLAKESGRSSASLAVTGLDDRLGNLLISAVSPTLRPIAKKVLAPGSSLVRRIRNEFPRLATHLGFRESEDTELLLPPWTAAELSGLVEEVRACRDRLLSMDVTKMLMTWLNQ